MKQRATLIVSLIGLVALGGRTSLLAQAAPTNMFAPTVTAAMGDLGGKFFGQVPDPKRTRHYYIAAEPQLWDYAPAGRDVICGKPLPPPVLAQRKGGKVRYVQYTDETFQTMLIEDTKLGILGPVLRGVVGEYLAITFVNRVAQPLSMHPHGVKYDKDSEGSYYEPKPGLGAAVAEGAKFTYVWHLDEESGPMPDEPSSKAWLYHSHVQGDEEAALGLIGFIIVTDPKRARPDGSPMDVDRELAAHFMIFDESGLGAAAKEAAEYASLPGGGPPALTWTQLQEQMEQGARHAINGYIFGNTPGLEMNEGERVRWYLFALGSEQDFHTAHWHGLRVREEGRRRTDVVELLPATMKVADMYADNPGSWLFHCHVADHMTEGMFARVIVHPKNAPKASRASDRAFFGMHQAQESLQIKRAEAALDLTPGKPCDVKVEGAVTVFHAFSIFTQPIEFRLGEKTISFKPDRRGTASNAGSTLTIKNASPYGVVYGGLMEFEVTLSGEEWLTELKRLGYAGKAGELPANLTMSVGKARHSAPVQITLKTK